MSELLLLLSLIPIFISIYIFMRKLDMALEEIQNTVQSESEEKDTKADMDNSANT